MNGRDHFGADVAATGGVLWEPTETFRRFAGRSPLIAPWLVVSVLSMVLTLLTVSVSQRAAAELLREGTDPELAAQVAGSLERARWFSVAASPLSVLARWLFASALLWALAVWTLPSVNYRSVLTVVAYSALPGVLGQGLDLYLAWTEGPEFTAELVPIFTRSASLAAFLPEVGSRWGNALVERVTFFGIWSGALWLIGVRERFGTGWGRAVATVAPVWALIWVLGAAAELLGRSLSGEGWSA